MVSVALIEVTELSLQWQLQVEPYLHLSMGEVSLYHADQLKKDFGRGFFFLI